MKIYCLQYRHFINDGIDNYEIVAYWEENINYINDFKFKELEIYGFALLNGSQLFIDINYDTNKQTPPIYMKLKKILMPLLREKHIDIILE